MSKYLRALFRHLLSLLCIAAVCAGVQADGADGRIVVYALGDIQSQLLPVTTKVNKTTVVFGGLAHAGGVIAKHRSEERDPVLVLQTGDAVSGPMWRAFSGEPEFAAMERIGVRAGTLGELELDYGAAHILRALGRSRMVVVSSNVSFEDCRLRDRVPPNALLREGHLTVGLFGLLSPQFFALPGDGGSIKVDNKLDEISKRMIDQLREQGADIIILLSRLPMKENIRLAEQVAGIHAILGGADREAIHETFLVEGPGGWETLLGQGGANASFVGRLYLSVEHGRLKRDETEWRLLRVTPDTQPDSVVMEIAVDFEERLNSTMLETVGFFSDPVNARERTLRTGEAALGNFITDALRHELHTDIGIVNAGGVRGNRVIPAGSITRRTLLEILPFGNDIHIVSLTGRELRQLFEISASALTAPGEQYQSRLRTYSGGFLQVSGVRVVYSLSGKAAILGSEGGILEQGNRVKSLLIERNGVWIPPSDEAVYTIAVNSWTAGGGDRYFVLRDAPQRKTAFRDIDVLADYIAGQPDGKVVLSLDGRIKVER